VIQHVEDGEVLKKSVILEHSIPAETKLKIACAIEMIM
jgi:hypothetical protein